MLPGAVSPTPIPRPAPEAPPPPRSRRAILAAALGGLAGSLATALARPLSAEAAAGDNLKLGATNYAGTSATRLNATSSGGAFWMTQNGTGSGVRGDSVSGHGGVFTTSHVDRYGLYAQQNAATQGAGAAVRADGGQNIGLSATSAHGTANAIDSRHTADGSAVYGHSGAGDGIFGESVTHNGVEGKSGSGTGVSGSSANVGVYGLCTSNLYGVYGDTSTGYGVYGNSSSGYGVGGFSDSVAGVAGQANTGFGVYGISNSSHAGYFAGSCYAASFTTTASPVVRLDHPLAPATRVLAHAAVISDAPATMYSGTVTTDDRGEARVQLPSYFEALNTDVRYQLTVVGSFAQAIVKSKVWDGAFTIATSVPGVEVCWLVTGVRRDAYARAHQLEVESNKSGPEKGRYLNPVELGQQESKGVDWKIRQRLSASRTDTPGRAASAR
jgi:hypothetical protein